MCDGTSENRRNHLPAFVSQTCYFKVIFYLRKVNPFPLSCFLKRTLIMCMAGREYSFYLFIYLFINYNLMAGKKSAYTIIRDRKSNILGTI